MGKMNDKELRELDAWIAGHVTNKKPFKVGMALNADESGVALVEGELIGRHDVQQFCRDHPEYHFKVVDEYPRYSADPSAAMEVLKKCGEECGVIYEFKAGQASVARVVLKNIETEDCTVDLPTFAPTLELAICLFAQKLFTK